MVNERRTAVLFGRHPLWLDALETLLTRDGFEVLGRTSTEDESVALVAEHRPDVFVADLDVSRPSHADLLKRAAEAHPTLRSVVVSDSTSSYDIEAAFAAGAVVYCVKTASGDDIASAVRQAFVRSVYVATRTPMRAPASANDPTELTRRELEILQLVAEGHSNSQLAKMLWVTEQTVKFHLSNIYRKLGVSNRTEASRSAQVKGLLRRTADGASDPSLQAAGVGTV